MTSMAAAVAGLCVFGLIGCSGTPDGQFAGVEGTGAHGDATKNVKAAPAPKVTSKSVPAPAEKAAPRESWSSGAPAATASPSAGAAAPGEPVPPPFSGLTTSQQVVDILKDAEGLRLEAYQGPSGTWLIGYGHAGTAEAGMTITAEEAEALLREDLLTFEEAVRDAVSVPVTGGEFSALTYFAYTIGTGAFASSSVVRLLNQGDRAGAADAFLLWTKIRQDGELVESPGLLKLRQKQRALFLGETL